MGSYSNTATGGTIGAPVTYSIANVAVDERYLATKMAELAGVVNQELQRRTTANRVPTSYVNGKILAEDINKMQGLLATAPYAYAAGFANVSVNNKIFAANVNQMILKVKNAGAQCLCDCNYCTCDCNYCTCNCNYCTCDCNYCTCNCNYACTCNCNYSDARLKENIVLLGKQQDLNVYSYTYVWNKNKTYQGVLAQELIGTKYETALGKDKDGFYYVDYSQLPVNMLEI